MTSQQAGGSDEASLEPHERTQRRGGALLIWILLLAGLAGLLSLEARQSWLQSWVFHWIDRKLTWTVEDRPSGWMRLEKPGPFELRRGYALLPQTAESLEARQYRVTAQARPSVWMRRLAEQGIGPIYHETPRGRFVILDRSGGSLYDLTFPERTYASYDSIPKLVIETLLFIENREFLDNSRPYFNPAVEWDRLAKATLDLGLNATGLGLEQPGGSTLATQIEKFRHSPGGMTSSVRDKLCQMTSASLRAYLDGRNTIEARRRIVLDYINSVPLAALPGYGEVTGLGDGLWAWFDTDVRDVNRLLATPRPDLERRALSASGLLDGQGPGLEEQARAYKQVLGLFIAHRRPSVYLITDREMLAGHANQYLRLLCDAGIIGHRLRDAALATPLEFRRAPIVRVRPSFIERKATNAIRARLLALTGVEQLYDLDRMDLRVESTLDGPTQRRVTETLERLRRPGFADSAGLRGEHLLAQGDPAGVVYSFTLYEATPEGNMLRVQADNLDQPLDINEGVKLELGSTAKLRTLVNYLEIASEMHHTHASRPRAELAREAEEAKDPLRRWGLRFLADSQDTSLAAMLESAMDRRYSASPGETFFTGGGLHTFANFKHEDDKKILSVREGFRNSVNLVFIRVMRDIVRYYREEIPAVATGILENPEHPARTEYLGRFADREGKEFLAQFWRKYQGKRESAERLQVLAEAMHATPRRLAAVYRSVRPQAGLTEFSSFLRRNSPGSPLSGRQIESLYETYSRDRHNLTDRGYLARIHPLELWLLEYLEEHPRASWREIVAASAEERREAYAWLLRPSKRHGQDTRIRTILEGEAFTRIHAAWKRMGYPFETLVPSYATSIGSSADRPAALAELMGIIVNGGLRWPRVRLGTLGFAEGTPYEVRFVPRPRSPVRVLPVEVARVVRASLLDVVENGTARRALGTFRRADGNVIPLGGKTGTGDNRHETYAPGGKLLRSRALNRTASFVFLIGDRFFGTLSVHVPGEDAAGYEFTSSLPVQVMKVLGPDLMPLVSAPDGGSGGMDSAEAVRLGRSAPPDLSHPGRTAAGRSRPRAAGGS